MNAFQNLGLEESSLQAISDLGFKFPTEIQTSVIPLLLNDEHDLVALAQTGTGKTAAFGFPLIQSIAVESRTTQGLILAPTRELCLQITNELKHYGKYYSGLNITAIYGGASISEQAKQIRQGAQIVVATPGRIKDMISRRLVDITKIQYAVLDEADEMLNMGFYEDITSILSHTPEDKSTWLFSATMPKEVEKIARKFMHQPIEITVGNKNQGAVNVSHEYYMVNARDRYRALKRLADANPDIFSVIFCRTKRDTQKIAEKLIEDGYNAGSLHGDLSQNQRDLVMKAFRNKQIQMLVATDVAARGIDVDDITHVINYQLPDEIETYTHRSGRTGRAGKTGVSMVIITKSELRKISQIEKIIKKGFEQKDIPDGMEICQVQLMSLANKVHETEVSSEIEPYLTDIFDLFKDSAREDLIRKFFSVEFDRFYNYYNKETEIGSPQTDESASSRTSSGVRFYINLGSKDGFNWMSLKDFLKAVLELGQNEVFRVDVKNTFSFFNTELEHKERVLELFSNFNYQGRRVHAELTEHPTRKGRKDSFRKKDKNARKRKQKKNGSNNFSRSKKSGSPSGEELAKRMRRSRKRR